MTLNPQVHELIDTSLKVEGMPRHASTHAAGVVITREPATEYVPLSTNDGLPVTQFNMVEIERLGLLKMDFLGLRTLTVTMIPKPPCACMNRISALPIWIMTMPLLMLCWNGAKQRASSSLNLLV